MSKKYLYVFSQEETGFGDLFCLFIHERGYNYRMVGIEREKRYNGETRLFYFSDFLKIKNIESARDAYKAIMADTDTGLMLGGFDSFEEIFEEFPETAPIEICI